MEALLHTLEPSPGLDNTRVSSLPEELRLQLLSSLVSVQQECRAQEVCVERVLPELGEAVASIRDQSKAREEDGAHLNRLAMRRMPLRSEGASAATCCLSQLHALPCS